MVLATMRDNTYNFFLFIHVVSFLAAFAPAVINPMLASYFEKNGGEPVLRTWAGFTVKYTQTVVFGGLGSLLVTGVIMIVLSDSVIEFSQTWISLAFLVWLAIGGVVSAMILKGEKAVADGDASSMALVEKGGKIATLLTVVMLYLMVFKPGF